MVFANSHKTKGKTAIAFIGTMHSMVDFSSLCINMDTIITAICSNDEPQLILCKSFSTLLPQSTIKTGYIGRITLAQCIPFIGTVAVSSSKSSTALPILPLIFGNGNIMSEACPITKLNTSPLKVP